MDDLKATYNRIAKDWDKDHRIDTWWIAGTDKFVSFLKKGDAVLDAGCGGGVKSEYLVAKGLQVLGIDFSEAMVGIARERVSSATFSVLDIRDLENLKEKFDGVFAQAVVLHVPKAEVVPVLRQLRSALKPGGYLYVAVKEIRPGRAEEEVVAESDYGYPYSRFFSYFTIEELRRFLGSLQMEIVFDQITKSGSTNWLQIIARK
jgi:2-polyprenyl-3-methyl-5-hydroxy-6-metoxy-1,4-benzoquinol methylase